MALASTSLADSTADRVFRAIADDFISDLPTFSPVNATLLGEHSGDALLDQVDGNARRDRQALYKRYLERLGDVDPDDLSRANLIDAELLRNELESNLWATDVLQEWAWNPIVYARLSGGAIYGLLARDFAPVSQRLDSAASRLQQFPRFFAQARGELQTSRVPKIHAETAIRQTQGLHAIIDNRLLPELEALDPASRERMNSAIEIARNAIAEHQTWLEQEMLPRASGEFRIGAQLYDRKLAFTLNSPLSRREIRGRAENEYIAVRDEMYEVARKIYADLNPYDSFPDDPDVAFKQVVIRAALEQAYAQMPERDGIVQLARESLSYATDFVREHNIVTVPDEPLEIIVMPEFQRGVSLAYLDPPGPLDRGQSSFYAVAPLPEPWTDAQVTSFLREYNVMSVHNLTIHEAMPGHYLQVAHSNRYPSTLRSILYSGPFVEGWAVYTEQVMVEAGYMNGDPLMRLIQLKWYLRAITNAIIDQAIHVEGMSREAAMKLMIEGGFQEEREAAGKWIRAQLTSAQLSTYFVGFQEHMDMRKAVEKRWGDEFSLRRYHDQALSYGSPPVKYVRALILDEPVPRQESEH
ncbi:MAG: DUF885 domain-containing protein [Gammaproteobacteria bacterium]|nr:DUF885 domain-containing protein [Gammaproteobacteria bacterium]